MRIGLGVLGCWAAVVLGSAVIGNAEVTLPGVIGSNMVLQREMPVKVWGWAKAGEKVTVRLEKQSVEAVADKDGKWLVKLEAMPAGGPYEMTVAGTNTIKLENVMVGEVWVCSGQSNMETVVPSAQGGKEEVATANFPKIRLFSHCHASAVLPTEQLGGKWVECSPESVAGFSATGYYFGKHIFKALKEQVAVGMIQAWYGGTPVTAWIPPCEYMPKGKPADGGVVEWADWVNETPGIRAQLDEEGGLSGPKYAEAVVNYNKKMDEFEAANYVMDPGNQGFGQGWADPKTEVGDWKECKLPATMEAVRGAEMNGGMWFRREVDVPEKWAGKDLTLGLGVVNDLETAYFNNEKVGATVYQRGRYGLGWRKATQTVDNGNAQKGYKIAGKLVKAGKNVVAVRVWNVCLTGGMIGPASGMRLGLVDNPEKEKAVGLEGTWKWQVELEAKPKIKELVAEPRQPLHPGDMYFPGSVYNGTIHPLINYGIRGVIWHQGENDISVGGRYYRKTFPAMIRGWRAMWGEGDFSFLFAQLQDWYPEGSFATHEMQEAQLQTLALKNTGMAVIEDVTLGQCHFANKPEVARRLGLVAMGTVYGEKDLEYSEPLYSGMKVEGNKVVVSFTCVGSGLAIKKDAKGGEKAGRLAGFALAGDDQRFLAAQAKIEGQTVVVWADGLEKPVAVRYGWEMPGVWVAHGNLTNGSGLPASSFRSDDWARPVVVKK